MASRHQHQRNSRQWTVVLSVEDTVESVRAYHWVMESAVSAGCLVEVLHVYDGFIPGAKQTGARIMNKYTNVLTKMSKAWKFHFNTKLLDCGGKPPGQAIKWYCNETEPSLLVIASRGMGSVKRHVLGSCSDYCVHHVRCPIVVVKKNEESMTTSLRTLELRRRLSDPKVQADLGVDARTAEKELQQQESKRQRTIVFAVDKTDHCERACHWVLDILPPTVDLTILHVAKSSNSGSPLGRRRSLGGANNEAEGFRLLSHYTDIVNAKGAKYQLKTKLMKGKPAEEIAKYCEEVRPNLLVTASRGLRQLKRQILGSVSSEVVHMVACPVLVFKDEYTRGRKRSNAEKARAFMLETWADDKEQSRIEKQQRRASGSGPSEPFPPSGNPPHPQDAQDDAAASRQDNTYHTNDSQPNSPKKRLADDPFAVEEGEANKQVAPLSPAAKKVQAVAPAVDDILGLGDKLEGLGLDQDSISHEDWVQFGSEPNM